MMPPKNAATLSSEFPYRCTYDAQNPTGPNLFACMSTYGGFSDMEAENTLLGQQHNDYIVLGGDAVPLSNTSVKDYNTHCCVNVAVRAFNVATKHQFFLAFHLWTGRIVSPEPTPTAQLFVGSKLVRAEEVKGSETIAALVDCPGHDIIVPVTLMLAAPDQHRSTAALIFKSVDVWLL